MIYVMFSIPLALFTLWFAVDTYQIVHAHNVVYDAAKAAAVSAATQAQYSAGTTQNGAGFTKDVNSDTGTYIANQVFADEEQQAGLYNVLQIQSASVSYPSPSYAQYTVVVSYTPGGIYAGLNLLMNLFENQSISATPFTWTVAPVAHIQGQSVDMP